MNLLDQVKQEARDGVDSTVAEVECSAGFRLRISRVSSTAPMLQGVSALFVVLPANKSAKPGAQKPASLLGSREAKAIADILQSLLLQSVTGTRGTEDEEWVPVKLVAEKAQENAEAGLVWIGRIPDSDQLRCYDAITKLHTGEGMATLIATAFRFAADSVAPALARLLLRMRPMDGGAVEPGAPELQRDGDAGGGAGGDEAPPEGQGGEASGVSDS